MLTDIRLIFHSNNDDYSDIRQPGTEQLATVATMMTSFREREFDATRNTAVAAVIFDPMINNAAAGLVCDVPHVHATLGVTNVQALVISAITRLISQYHHRHHNTQSQSGR